MEDDPPKKPGASEEVGAEAPEQSGAKDDAIPTIDAAAAIAAEMTGQVAVPAEDSDDGQNVDIDIEVPLTSDGGDADVELFADPSDDAELEAQPQRSVMPPPIAETEPLDQATDQREGQGQEATGKLETAPDRDSQSSTDSDGEPADQGGPADDEATLAAAQPAAVDTDAEAAQTAPDTQSDRQPEVQADRNAGAQEGAQEGRAEGGTSGLPTPAAPRGGAVPVTGDEPAVLKPLRIIAIGGSRGGVGKTVLATNLALYLANIGRRVVLVDADPGGASIHAVLGTRMTPSLARIRRTTRGDGPAIPDEALASTPFQGLQLLYAGLDEPAAAGSRGDRLTKLMERLRSLKAEYVLVDLGVGLSREVLDAYLVADQSLFVTVPEPTAIENTYRFLRGAFFRYLMNRPEVESDERAELERRFKAHGSALGPLELLDELEREHHPLRDKVRLAMQDFRPLVAINQTRLRADLQLGFAMESAARRRLGVRLEYVGHVDHDDTVWTCIRNRRPVLLDVPGAKSSKKIEKLARRLLMIQAGKDQRVRLPSVPQHSHHDMLELERGATDEEIRRAYKRTREIYAHDALCCYGLFESSEIEKLRSRIDEAFDVLLDPARRRPYELSVFAEEPEPEASTVPEEDSDRPARPMPNIDPDTEFTGNLLRDVREARRATLREISQRTKVGIPYLKAIEQEDFSRLPAAVYTRGFVGELARYLKLDVQQVSRTYGQRYQAYLDNKQRNLLRGR